MVLKSSNAIKPTGVRIPPRLKEELLDYAAHAEMSVSAVILEAIREYISK